MRVVYLGQYDPEYDRNAVIRQGLKAQGVEVIECRIGPEFIGLKQYTAMIHICCKIPRPDAVILAEFNPFLAPLARLLTWRWQAPFIFDPLVSMYQTVVDDRQLISPLYWQASRHWLKDWLAFHIAGKLLADTRQHKLYYSHLFGVSKRKITVVPVGARTDIFYPHSSPDGSDFNVLFWGSYIPLQGVEWIINAAQLLRSERSINWIFIGNGQTYWQVRQLSDQLKLPRVRFIDRRISRIALAEAIANADITLGIFGQTPKAQRVVPNKVYQGLAMAKPVITGDSPAIREFFDSGEHLHTVPMANSTLLSEAILLLVRDKEYRCYLSQQGYKYFLSRFQPIHIGQQVKNLLEHLTDASIPGKYLC